jgi:hypothetical protein
MKKSNEKENKNNQEPQKKVCEGRGKKKQWISGNFFFKTKLYPTNKTHNEVHWCSNSCIGGCWVILALEGGVNWSLTIGFGLG